nr:uncharacterized protein LOC124215114 [Neodiprion pinetum]
MLKNEAHRTYLIQKLESISGLSQRKAVINMLKFVMSNSLAMMYNWAGRDKKCFNNTKFMKILNEAAKVAFRGKPESSDPDITSAVKDWLKLATSRHVYAIASRKTMSQ